MQYRISVKIEWRPQAGVGKLKHAPPMQTHDLRSGGAGAFALRTVCSLIALSEGGPAGRAFLAEGAKPFAEIVAGKYLIPHVASDFAGILPVEPPDALHEGHPLLDSRRTES